MNKIKFNNTEFESESYNRTTYFGGETVTSNASCSLLNADMDDIEELVGADITSIQIRHDGNLIYDLQNISAKLDNSNEYFSGDRMNIGLNFTFTDAISNT